MIRSCLMAAALITVAAAQAPTASIRGTVTDPEGRPVPSFPVQATNQATQAVFTAQPSPSGEYMLGPLPAGTYRVELNTPRVIFNPFVREGLEVAAGQAVPLDIHLEEGIQLNTAGDGRDFFLNQARSRPAPPDGPAPRTADGKPDFSGLWWNFTVVDPGKPEMTASAEAVQRERLNNSFRDYPPSRCQPSGIVLMGMFSPFRIVQTPGRIVAVYEGEIPGFRDIPTDGRSLPEDLDPTWLGQSAGHWEGDTLVVGSAGFNDRTWLDGDGRPHTEQMRVTERYRRPDRGHLEAEVTIDDPGAYARPWTIRKVANLMPPGEAMLESICTENNRDVEHLQ